MVKYVLLKNQNKIVVIDYFKLSYKSDGWHVSLKLVEPYNRINGNDEFTLPVSFEEYTKFINSDSQILEVSH